MRSLILRSCLAACTAAPTPPPAPPQVVAAPLPAVASPAIGGRWTIVAVDSRPAAGAWLELGGEGLGAITETEQGIFVGSPEPRTQAYLGCNTWHLNGWTRSGDTLTLGINMSVMTERGCAEAVMAIEDRAYAILREPLGMAFSGPNWLIVGNAVGTVELSRDQSDH